MSRDTQLQDVRLDQALNTKEFAVLAGSSYSSAREWFRSPGFPVRVYHVQTWPEH